MDMSSWFRRVLLKNKPTSSHTTQISTNSQRKLELGLDEEELGVTEELQNFVKSFTVDTFKSFPLQDDQTNATPTTKINGSSLNTSTNKQEDLSEWQERHASLVLSKVKEISQLRYVLCPRILKERQFWSIYFSLVKSYVTPYEIRAIQKAKLRRIGKEKEQPSDSAAYEVEMAETKGRAVVTLDGSR